MSANSPTPPLRPIDAAWLRSALVAGPNALYTSVEVVDEIGSTNAEMLRRAEGGATDRSVLLAEYQGTGRGRLGRSWTAPPRTQVALSVLLRPGAVSPHLFGWLPLVTGLAVRDALITAGGVDATLKWPNDVLIDGRKTAGILVEVTMVSGGGDYSLRLPALVVGVGINVGMTHSQLPVPHATSVTLAGGTSNRDAVALAVLDALAHRHAQWRSCDRGSGSVISDELVQEYTQACSTIGSEVRVELPGDIVRTGRAARVDREGRLVVVTDDGSGTSHSEFAVAAGDVTHLRGTGGRWGG